MNAPPRLPATLLSLAPLLLIGACAAPPQPLPPVTVRPAMIPPLPPEAIQPEPPPVCWPNCSDGLARLLDQLADTLTTPGPPGSRAKELMKY